MPGEGPYPLALEVCEAILALGPMPNVHVFFARVDGTEISSGS